MFGKSKEGSGLGKFMRKPKESPRETWVQKYKDAKNLNQGLCVLVLAAGSGQRMNSDLPLVCASFLTSAHLLSGSFSWRQFHGTLYVAMMTLSFSCVC